MHRPEVDVVVIGGGAAGLAAADAAARAGASVILMEAGQETGGLIALQPWTLRDRFDMFGGLTGEAYARVLERSARDAGAELLANALVWDVDRDLTVSFAVGDMAHRVRAGRLVVATGSTDGVSPFPGWTLPGVVLLREAMAVLSSQGLSPGLRALVVGGGDAALTVARGLLQRGAEAAAVACAESSIPASRVLVEAAAAEGVDLLPGHRVSEALGERVVERARINQVDGAAAKTIDMDVDSIILATHRIPDFRAASLLGARACFSEEMGGWVPRVDPNLRSSDHRVFIAGDAAGVGNGASAIYGGRLAGLMAASDAGFVHREHDRLAAEAADGIAARTGARRASGRQQVARERVADWSSLPESVIVCRCTGTTLGDVSASIEPAGATAAEIRRLSRAGMGLCQGIYCDDPVAEIVAARAGVAVSDVGRPRARSPLRPIPLAALAGICGRMQDLSFK